MRTLLAIPVTFRTIFVSFIHTETRLTRVALPPLTVFPTSDQGKLRRVLIAVRHLRGRIEGYPQGGHWQAGQHGCMARDARPP